MEGYQAVHNVIAVDKLSVNPMDREKNKATFKTATVEALKSDSTSGNVGGNNVRSGEQIKSEKPLSSRASFTHSDDFIKADNHDHPQEFNKFVEEYLEVYEKKQTRALELQKKRIENMCSDPLLLDGNSRHAKEFNELVRRIKTEHYKNIVSKINQVSDDQLQKLATCCQNPSQLLGIHRDFFDADDFPYVLLRAFRDDKINVNAFATLVSLHGIYKEGLEENKDFELYYLNAFDADGYPNQEMWQIIEKTIVMSNNAEYSAFQFDSQTVIFKMQKELKAVSLIESALWYYEQPSVPREQSKMTADDLSLNFFLPDYLTIGETVRKFGVFVLSRFDDKEMMPSFTLRQSFLKAAFGEEANIINPVIGVSSVDDLRQGAERYARDFALPFPQYSLPKMADGRSAPRIPDFQIHDYYHLLRVSLMPRKDIDLYLRMGDALKKQKDCYESAVSYLKNRVYERLKNFNNLRIMINKIKSADKKVKYEDALNNLESKLEKNLFSLFKAVSYLKKCRKATGKLKASIYDLEITGYNHWAKAMPDLYRSYLFHIDNIESLFNSSVGVNDREKLHGMSATLAGRAVLPLIDHLLTKNKSDMFSLLSRKSFGEDFVRYLKDESEMSHEKSTVLDLLAIPLAASLMVILIQKWCSK